MNNNISDNYEIIEVTTAKLLKIFIDLPFQLYKNHKYWTPPLKFQEQHFYNPKKNAFFEHATVKLFLCFKNKKPAGRISFNINDNYNSFQNERIGFWGSFETIDDFKVIELVFSAGEKFFKENGIDTIRGPFTFSTNEISGLLVDSFDSQPMIMMPYNHQYYENLLVKNGHCKIKDLWAYYLDYETYKKILAVDISKFESKYKLTCRKINFKKFEDEIKILSSIYNDAWEKNWGFVPMTYKEFYNMAAELKTFIPEECVLIAYTDGLPSGFLIALPDFNLILKNLNGKLLPFGWLKVLLNQKNIRRGRVVTLGISHKFRRRAIDIYLIQQAIKFNGERFKDGTELSWILEDNIIMNKILMNFGLMHYKTYRIFEKKYS